MPTEPLIPPKSKPLTPELSGDVNQHPSSEMAYNFHVRVKFSVRAFLEFTEQI